MPIETRCRQCDARLQTDNDSSGEPIRCPACQTLNLAASEDPENCYFCGDALSDDAFQRFEEDFLSQLEQLVATHEADHDDDQVADESGVLPTCEACLDSIEENQLELEVMRRKRDSFRGAWLTLALGLILIGLLLALVQMTN